MYNFYELIDIYAKINNIDKTEALHMWYRGSILGKELLDAWLINEGIIGYTEELISIFQTLEFEKKRRLKLILGKK